MSNAPLPPVRPIKAGEVVRGVVLNTNEPAGIPGAVVTVDPTQVRRPWRSTTRTIFQLVLAIATLLPFVATGVYEDLDQAPVVVGQLLAAAATVTRVMALPQVEQFLRRWAPWLAAAPASGVDELT